MPIRLNLLREYHAAEEARRKDPVKRAILAGVVMVVCTLAWSLVLQFKVMRSDSEYGSIQSRWKTIETAFKKVVDDKKQAQEAEARLASLQQFTTNRFLWGGAMNELQHVLSATEGGVTVLRLRGEQTYSAQAEFKPKSPKEGPARQASVIEKIQLTLDARDASAQPGDQVPKLKASFASPRLPGAAGPFATNQVALLTISAPQNEKGDKDAAAGNSFVTFTLQATYPDRVRH